MYWYKFMWHGELVRESTKQGNDDVARQMEAAHRTSLAKGEVGIREKKQYLLWARSPSHNSSRGLRRRSRQSPRRGSGIAMGCAVCWRAVRLQSAA